MIKFLSIDRYNNIDEISVEKQMPKFLKLANKKIYNFKELYLSTDDMIIAYSKDKFTLSEALKESNN